MKNILLAAMLCVPFFSIAQFGYMGGGIGFRTTILNKGDAFTGENTTHNVTSIDLGGMYRPYRFLGVGVSVSIPVSQASTFSFNDARTSNGDQFFGFGAFGTSEFRNRNKPQKFVYEFDQSTAITVLGRLYVAPDIGIYFNLRYTMMTFSENFIFEREAKGIVYHESGMERFPAISAENIHYFSKSNLNIPGLGFGIQRHVARHLYFNFNINFDFMNIKNEGFSYSISHDYNYLDDYDLDVFLTDQTNGAHISFALQVAVGYTF